MAVEDALPGVLGLMTSVPPIACWNEIGDSRRPSYHSEPAPPHPVNSQARITRGPASVAAMARRGGRTILPPPIVGPAEGSQGPARSEHRIGAPSRRCSARSSRIVEAPIVGRARLLGTTRSRLTCRRSGIRHSRSRSAIEPRQGGRYRVRQSATSMRRRSSEVAGTSCAAMIQSCDGSTRW